MLKLVWLPGDHDATHEPPSTKTTGCAKYQIHPTSAFCLLPHPPSPFTAFALNLPRTNPSSTHNDRAATQAAAICTCNSCSIACEWLDHPPKRWLQCNARITNSAGERPYNRTGRVAGVATHITYNKQLQAPCSNHGFPATIANLDNACNLTAP